jgi:hypothetical protein
MGLVKLFRTIAFPMAVTEAANAIRDGIIKRMM